MRILTLDQSFQAKKINLKDYAIFEEPILTNEKIISPKDTREFNYKMQKVLAEYKQKALRTLENAKNVSVSYTHLTLPTNSLV